MLSLSLSLNIRERGRFSAIFGVRQPRFPIQPEAHTQNFRGIVNCDHLNRRRSDHLRMGKSWVPRSGNGLREFETRELGGFRPVAFMRRAGGAEALVKRLTFHARLRAHEGCVNTVHFNQSGDTLVSGSDDKQIIFWNWAAQSKRFSYQSGHYGNVLQARIMPLTNDRKVVTSGADGRIRLGQISDDGKTCTTKLGAHKGRAHKLAIEPESPHIFYSCGEDGFVQRFDLRSSSSTKLFSCSSSGGRRPHMPLNTIVINPRNPNYFSVGGLDEYVRVYDTRNYRRDSTALSDLPVKKLSLPHLVGSSDMQITGLSYSSKSELLVSYSDELIYLFPENMDSSQDPQVFSGHRNSQTVKSVSFFGPNDEYVVSGSDCGHVYIWKKKDGELIRMMMGDKGIVNCVEPHPHFPFLATCGLEKNVKLWMPTAKKTTSNLPSNAKEIMASNKRDREHRAYLRVTLPQDLVTHVLILQRRQVQHFIADWASNSTAIYDNHDDNVDGGGNNGQAFSLRFAYNDGASRQVYDPDGCSIC